MIRILMRRLRNYFVTGLVVLLPIVVTFTVFWNLFVKVDSFLGEQISRYAGRTIPGLGFVAMVILILFVGLLASNLIGRRLIALGEWILVKIPLVNKIYTGVQQIASVLFRERKAIFREVVMIEYPRKGVHSIAFVTNDASGGFPVHPEGELLTVFLPTTPNPTSGFLLIIPRSDAIPLAMSIEEGIKLVISGGSVLPQMMDQPPRSS